MMPSSISLKQFMLTTVLSVYSFISSPSFATCAYLDLSKSSSLINSIDINDLMKGYFDDLKKKGITRIKGRSIDDLTKQLAKVRFRFVDELKYINQDATYRSSGCWNKDTNEILISKRHIEQSLLGPRNSDRNSFVSALSAHEFFGFSGIPDESFQLSSLIETLFLMEKINSARAATAKEPSFDSTLLDSVKHSIQIADGGGDGGGSSGVGGGGDGRVFQFVNLLQSEILFIFKMFPDEAMLYNCFQNVLRKISIEFDPVLAVGSHVYDTKIKTLRVPPNSTTIENIDKTWDSLPPVLKHLIEEVKKEVQNGSCQ